MNSYVKTALIVLGVLAIAAVFITAGIFIGQRLNWWNNYRFDNDNNISTYQGGGMMRNFNNNNTPQSYGRGRGMMGSYYNGQNPVASVLSMEEARDAFENYLENLGNDDLEIEEIMVFDQNAYAVVAEKSSGIGAMELLVDPDTLAVYPEYGPNRMWNTKYGMMGGKGGCGFSDVVNCGMGYYADADSTFDNDLDISMSEAADIADEYLADKITGAEVMEDGYPFYGYYTFDYKQDGQMAGMLSVHGNNGQAWLHTWHGQFIEEWELEEHD